VGVNLFDDALDSLPYFPVNLGQVESVYRVIDCDDAIIEGGDVSPDIRAGKALLEPAQDAEFQFFVFFWAHGRHFQKA
jgi:hypothetical protein